MKLIGIDIGNDSIKIKAKDNEINIMNLISAGYNRRVFGQEMGHLSNLLDVSIESKGKDLGRYFIGGLAFKENRGDMIEKSRGETKAESDTTYIMILASLAYALYDENNPVKKEYVTLGAGLPTEEYFNDRLLDLFKSRLKGTHKVTFHSPNFKGAQITIIIDRVEVIPEGTSAALSILYDDKGRFKEKYEHLRDKLILIIDIGSLTVDVSTMENGTFIGKGFFGINKGIADPLNSILLDLKNSYGYETSRHKLDYYLRRYGFIEFSGNKISLTEMAERHFEDFTRVMANQIYKELDMHGLNINDVHTAFIVGGGAITLKNYLDKYLHFSRLEFAENPLMANAEGYLKSISFIAASGEEEKKEVFEEEVAISKQE
ncbi:plasmid segregation protein ParM [Caldanaerobius fijiensis DSM 17918]|uniref:Plasmid segregation protein ParM n=1 Tax=Caldanaerobius fijiensis DSM 17918 TaxID=1121256 RepID=A0A1M5EHG2_9THEO|nr:ParM/StbA family protein [Caldanaerobius fijiensis]SHF78679.1 plasmid segregation protein ParM [Caldanaerobius fijiensis DSM 17918]